MQQVKWAFHSDKIKYTIEKTYNPDFTIEKGDKRVYIEVKGYFQDSPEAAKYLWVRDVLGPNEELVFLFDKPSTKIHYLKPRQDGTKMDMAGWADKHGFRWFTMDNIQEVLID